MFFLISLLISLLLAIPTFGVSLIIFIIIKYWFDKLAVKSILGAAATSLRTYSSEERYHINRGALRMIFSRMCLSNANEEPLPGGGGMTVYSGVIIHHQINNGEPFTLRCLYTPRMGTRNTIFIRAAEGIDYSLIGSQGLLDEMSEAKERAASQGVTF